MNTEFQPAVCLRARLGVFGVKVAPQHSVARPLGHVELGRSANGSLARS